MADSVIGHRFVSAKADSPDPTIVSANEWNDAHVVSGGAHSQLLTRDTGSPNGASWINAPTFQTNTGSYSGGNLSGALAPIVVATNSNAVLQIIVTGQGVLASGTTATLSLYRDGTLTRQYPFTCDGLLRPIMAEFFSEPAGSRTYSLILSTAGPNFTSSTVTMQVMTIGRL